MKETLEKIIKYKASTVGAMRIGQQEETKELTDDFILEYQLRHIAIDLWVASQHFDMEELLETIENIKSDVEAGMPEEDVLHALIGGTLLHKIISFVIIKTMLYDGVEYSTEAIDLLDLLEPQDQLEHTADFLDPVGVIVLCNSIGFDLEKWMLVACEETEVALATYNKEKAEIIAELEQVSTPQLEGEIPSTTYMEVLQRANAFQQTYGEILEVLTGEKEDPVQVALSIT